MGENEKCKCLIFLLDLTTKTLQDVLKLQRRCQINENTGRFHSMALGILDAKIKVVTVGDTQCGTIILLRGRSKTTWTNFGLFNPATPPPCWTVLLNRTYKVRWTFCDPLPPWLSTYFLTPLHAIWTPGQYEK